MQIVLFCVWSFPNSSQDSCSGSQQALGSGGARNVKTQLCLCPLMAEGPVFISFSNKSLDMVSKEALWVLLCCCFHSSILGCARVAGTTSRARYGHPDSQESSLEIHYKVSLNLKSLLLWNGLGHSALSFWILWLLYVVESLKYQQMEAIVIFMDTYGLACRSMGQRSGSREVWESLPWMDLQWLASVSWLLCLCGVLNIFFPAVFCTIYSCSEPIPYEWIVLY